MLALLALAALSQLDMTPLLEKGPLVLVEEGAGGKFAQCSGVVLVDAPPDAVWAVIKAQDKFKDFVPKVLTSDVKPSGSDIEVHFVIEVPGPDTDYVIRYSIDEEARTMAGAWAKGDLKGSRWTWKVEPAPGGKTLLTHVLAVKNFSAVAQSLEDSNQTVTVGVNVSAVLAATKAVKRRAESMK
jgi:carbon monoxide dehydrogenase subunit G